MAMGVYHRYVTGHRMSVRVLMICRVLEGLLTCVVSVILYFVISDFPEEATWLSVEEKAFVKQRLYNDVGDSKRNIQVGFKDVLNVLKDCK